MGQIVNRGNVKAVVNLQAIQTVAQNSNLTQDGSKASTVLANGEIWLIDTTNSKSGNGDGKYDSYIVGNGNSVASALTILEINEKIIVDNSVTQGSTNAVSGGAVYSAILAIDVSSQISGKADKSEMSVVPGTGANADKTTITLKSGTSATVLTQHQDISGKQDTISNVTVAVDANTGTPAGTATFNNNTLELSFSNLKGEKGDTGSAGAQGIQGPTGLQGPKGDAGITGDVSDLVIKQAIDVTETYVDTDVAGAETVKTLTNEDLSNEEVIARALVELKSYQEDGYAYKGIVAENASVGEQIQKAAYIATPGTYRQFGDTNLVVPEDCLGIIAWDGTTWTLNTFPLYVDEVIIDNFSDWEWGYKNIHGIFNSSSNFQYKYIKVLAGQTITISTCGSAGDFMYLLDESLNPIIIGKSNTNVLATYTHTATKTQYYYVAVRTYNNSPSQGNLVPPTVTLSSVGAKSIKKENVVDFGKGDNWNDVVSAIYFKDKYIVTENDAFILQGKVISGYKEFSQLNINSAVSYRFENNSYKYIYCDVEYFSHPEYYGLSFFTEEATAETFISGITLANASVINGNRRIFKAEVPTNCKYIYVCGGGHYTSNLTKIFLFRDTNYITLRFLLDNFVLSNNTIFDNTTDVASYYSRYSDYVDIRNNFGKEGSWNIKASNNADFRCIFVSDIHRDVNAFKRIVNLTNAWADDGFVDAMILTGDIAYDQATEDYTWFHNLRAECNVDILTTPGNHDWNYNVTANQERTYNNIIAPMINGITINAGEENETVLGQVQNIVQPDDAAENFRLYYYKDYGNVRFIGIYTSVDSATQLTWLQNVLADAITNNKLVIIGNHSPFTSDLAPYKYNTKEAFYENVTNTFYTVDGTFHNTSATQLGSDTPIPTSYAAAVKTFMDNGGTFICWLTGHTHRDHFYDVTNHNLYGYQFMINTNGAVVTSGAGDMVRLGTGNRDCYNYITINSTQGLLKLLRIGSNVDAIGRGRTVFVYDYINHKVVVNY